MSDSMRDRIDAEAEADRAAMEAQQAPEPDPAPGPEPEPAPAIEEPPAEPAVATTEPAEPGKPRDDNMVPLAALKEERVRRQELERQQREMAQQMAELRGRFEGMMQQPKAAQPEPEKPDPEPKYDDNPAEWFRWRDRQQSKEIAALKKATETYDAERKQREQMQQQDQQRQQFLSHYANAAQEFARQTTDFGPAYQHLVRSRVEELIQAGYSSQQASQYQQQEEANIAAHALSQGANPAERLYAIAQMRGYSKAEEPAPAPAQAPAAPVPQMPTPAPSNGNGTLRAQLSKSLSSAPGAASNPPTTEQIANMSDAEYASLVPSTDAFRRMMGG